MTAMLMKRNNCGLYLIMHFIEWST